MLINDWYEWMTGVYRQTQVNTINTNHLIQIVWRKKKHYYKINHVLNLQAQVTNQLHMKRTLLM